MDRVSDAALKIVAEKPRFWQHRVFAQVLSDEIRKCAKERKEHKKDRASGPKRFLTEREFLGWIKEELLKQADLVGIYANAQRTLADLAFGPEGTDKDLTFMVDLAIEVGSAYCQAIEWSQQFRRASLPGMYQPFLKELAANSNTMIESIETLPHILTNQLAEFEASGTHGPFYSTLIVDFTPHNSEAMERERKLLFERIARKFKLDIEPEDL